ncbi:TPA: hypothetical protein ACXE8V_001621 [Pluralibacter gergoviae]
MANAFSENEESAVIARYYPTKNNNDRAPLEQTKKKEPTHTFRKGTY